MLAVAGLLVACFLTKASDKAETADPEATKLLADTRTQRAAWNDRFPGFTAAVTLNADGATGNAKLAVAADGTVAWEDLDAKKFPWAKPLVKVNVEHRMPSIPSKATPCRFGPDSSPHPLGREIVLIGDGMGSRYRIRDGQITVVNRDGPGPKFSTTVLSTEKTPEGTYLPTSFVITFWGKDGSIAHSDHHAESFVRLAGYDLPSELRLVSATKDGVSVRTVKLTDHKLANR